MDNKIKKKNPEVRFKGFTEDWNESNFSTTFNSLSNNTLSRADLNYKEGLAKNIHYGDILIKFNEILDVLNNEIPFISNNELVNKFKASKLENGDVIFADAAEDETVGKCTEIINIHNEIVYPGLHTIAVRPTFIFASKYLGYYLNSPAYHNQLLRLMQGTKVSSISKSAIKNTVVSHPNDTNEQKKIGSFFQNLDNLITLHQKKYDKLLILKKAMLVKMFPKNGAVVPEIRFKGFTEDWVVDTFSEIFNYERPDNYIVKSVIYSNAFKTPVLTANKGFILGYSNEVNTFKEKCIIFDDFTLDRKYVDFHFMVKSSALKILTLKNESRYNLLFSFNLLNNTKIEIMGHARHYISIVQPTIILVPKISEQQKIGKYFKNLDNQIALHQTQLDKLNNIKKACFNKMFVAQD